LQDLLLELREGRANGNDAAFHGCFSDRCALATLRLALSTRLCLVQRQTDLTLRTIQVLKLRGEGAVHRTRLGPAVVNQDLVVIVIALLEDGVDVSLPDVLAEMRCDWVHD